MKRKICLLLLIFTLLLTLPSLFVSCGSAQKIPGSLNDISDMRIGVVTGQIYGELAAERFPDCEIVYFNKAADLAAALDAGRIDVYLEEEPIARLYCGVYTDQTILGLLSVNRSAYIFPKDSERATKLCEEMNTFLQKIKLNGTLEKIDATWINNNAFGKMIDTSDLTGENGTVTMAVDTTGGEPFTYYKDGQVVGYDVDIAVRFCREYGYNIEFADSDFAGVLASVSTGKADLGASCISITEERQGSLLFSDPNYLGGCAAVAKIAPETETEGVIHTTDDLATEKIGVVTGSISDAVVKDRLPVCTVEYYKSITDLIEALDAGKIKAYAANDPLASIVVAQNPGHVIIDMLSEEDYAFIFPKGDSKRAALCAEFNEFIEAAKSDGTLEKLQKTWFGAEEGHLEFGLSDLTGERGVLRLAVSTDIGEPFMMVRDGVTVGYDVDTAIRFCKAYDYKLEIANASFAGMLADVSAGKADFGASCITVTDERRESLLFSKPNMSGGTALIISRSAASKPISSIEDLPGKNVAVVTGTVHDVIGQNSIPGCRISYCNSNPDLVVALETGKVAAYIVDEPIARLLCRQYPDQKILTALCDDSFGFAFPKSAEKSQTLVAQMNSFLKKLRDSGTLAELDDIWFGADESRQTVDYSSLTGENGTLKFATSTDTGAPFSYIRNGVYIGYDVDIAVRFCREYGYNIEVRNGTFASVITDVSSGKADFAASCISITDERKETILFSDPDYVGGAVVVVRNREPQNSITSLNDLAYKSVGVLTGAMSDTAVKTNISHANVRYFSSATDLAVALSTGKISAYLVDEPVAQSMIGQYPDQTILQLLSTDRYGFIFPKNNEHAAMILEKFNEFLAKAKIDGTMSDLANIWFGTDEEKKVIDFATLTGENGTVKYSISTTIGVPVSYLKDNKFAGYEVDLVYRFCKAYGFALEIVDSDVTGMLANVASGKCDIGSGCIIITEERKESMLFSDVYYEGGMALVITENSGAKSTVTKKNVSFFASLIESFEKTFIREDRWKLFLSGIGTTLLITVLSALLGTLIGFLVFLFYRHGHRVPNAIVNAVMTVFQNTPVVVILMVLYYILFGKSDLDALWVSVIGFTLLFATGVIGLLKVGVGAIDRGQTEAALALGYTERQAFLKMVLPQAAKHFLPGYRTELVSLIKSTAIVGYITVQDLTKVGDIVRSRTYEAFFPLIATAVIYFAIALLLTTLVKRVEFGADPKRRKAKKILKGVKTK